MQYKRAKMNVADRAKQFMPFSPLIGLEAALRRVEETYVPQPELSEEAAAALDRVLHTVQKEDFVYITFYKGGKCLQKSGRIQKLDRNRRLLFIAEEEIPFDNLLHVEKM